MTGARRGVLALLAGEAVAVSGIRVAGIAIPWFVLTSTGSATQTGLVAAFELAPYVLAKALSGPAVDRLGQRRVSIAADLASAVLFGLVPVLHALGLLSLPVLLALVASGGAVRGPGDNAKHTSVPLVAHRAGVPLERVTGLYGAVERASGLVAPALAAVLIGLVSPTGAVAATAVCFAGSAAAYLLLMPRTVGVATGASPGPRLGYGRELVAGVRFLVADRLLLTLVLMIMVTNLLDVAKISVLLPVWADSDGHGVAAISLLLTCFAVTSVLSSLVASWAGSRMPRRLTYFVAFLVAGPPPFVALGLDLPVWAIAITYGVGGLAAGFLNPMIGAILFERIPGPLLGRVGGLTDAIAWSAMPFGGVLAAGLIGLVGLGPALLVAAGSYLAATLLPALAGRAPFDPPALERRYA